MRTGIGETQPAWSLTRRQHVILTLVFFVALLFRGSYLWGQARNNPLFMCPTMDALVHHQWAQQIASGGGMGHRAYFRAPLYYYMLAGLYKLVGPSAAAGRLMGSVLGAMSCYMVARLGAVLAGFRAGLLAGLIAAVYWPFIYFEAELLTVGLEVFLGVTLLWLLLLAAHRGTSRLFLLAGIVWGLSAITRPNVLAFGLGIALWLWLAPGDGERPLRRLRAAALMAVGAALVVLPVSIRNYVMGGEFVLIASNGGVNFYIGNNPQSDGFSAIVPGTSSTWQGGFQDTHLIPEHELGRPLTEGEVSDYWFTKALAWIRSDPRAWAKLVLHKFGLFWSPIEVPNNQPIWFFARLAEVSVLFWVGFPVVACLGVAGMTLLHRQWRTWFLPLAFLVIHMAGVVMFFCNGRYRLPMVPVLVVSAAAGLCRLVPALRTRKLRSIQAYLIAGVLCAGALLVAPPDRKAFASSSDGTAHYNIGIHYAQPPPGQAPDYAKAIEHLREALLLIPDDPRARLALAASLAGLKRVDEAAVEYARVVAQYPDNAEAHWDYALFLAWRGKLDEAAEQYRALLALQPWNVQGHHRLGMLLAETGHDAEAEQLLRTVVQLQPDLTEARHMLGVLLARKEKFDEAVALFKQVVQAEPANTSALCNLGNALTKMGRFAAALSCFQDALRQEPGLTAATLGLANVFSKTGLYAEAIATLKRGLDRAPHDLRLLDALAWVLATAPQEELRDGVEALRLARLALALAGRPHVDILDPLAAAYAELGRYEEAIETTGTALELARQTGAQDRVGPLAARLALYRQHRPYHEGQP